MHMIPTKLLGMGLALFLTIPVINLAFRVSAQELDSRAVTISLLTSAAVDDVVVSIDLIAKLAGGNDALRKRIGKLDITELKIGEDHQVVTAEQVRFRLLLADLDPVQFRLAGAKRTMIVENDEPITARKLIAAAQRAVRANYPGDADRLTITPCKGLQMPEVDAVGDARIRFEPTIRAMASYNGRVRVDVAIVIDCRKRAVAPVHLDLAEAVLPVQAVADKDSGIRPVANWVPASAAKECLIKSGDNVKIVAVLGSARIEATGEAQQDGRVGQVIRVRNLDSNRIVHGRVDASGAIIVEP